MLLRLNPLVVCLHVAVVVDADVFDVVVIFVGSYYRYFGRFCNGVVVTFLHRVLVGCISVAWITGSDESPECKRRGCPRRRLYQCVPINVAIRTSTLCW